jgi:hypothetical protein
LLIDSCEAGNTAEEVRRYFDLGIYDPEPPIIRLAFGYSLFTITECDPWVEPGYSALDIVDGDITGNVIVDSSELIMNRCRDGLYSISYSVTNSAGLTTVVTRNVEVPPGGDPQPPVITLSGRNPDTILVNLCETNSTG